jgi:hypothetical protein
MKMSQNQNLTNFMHSFLAGRQAKSTETTHGTCLPPEAYIRLASACGEPRYASTYQPRKEVTK